MGEYKVIEGSNSEVQKLLNTWRHAYYLEILGIGATSSGSITVIVLRTKKETKLNG